MLIASTNPWETNRFLAAAALSLCLLFLNQLPTWVGVRPVWLASSLFLVGFGYGSCRYHSRSRLRVRSWNDCNVRHELQTVSDWFKWLIDWPWSSVSSVLRPRWCVASGTSCGRGTCPRGRGDGRAASQLPGSALPATWPEIITILTSVILTFTIYCWK